jgi:hypothetical protein
MRYFEISQHHVELSTSSPNFSSLSPFTILENIFAFLLTI